MKNLAIVYFSPNGTVKKCVESIARGIEDTLTEEVSIEHINITKKENRNKELEFYKDQLVIIGIPVYAGRVPNILIKYLRTFKGNDAMVFPIVVYGNRHYDDALVELGDILEQCGFRVMGACAAIGQHSFSSTLGLNRPDENDVNDLRGIGRRLYDNIISKNRFDIDNIPGNRPYRPYYQPKDRNGDIVNFKDIKPETSNACIDCKICYHACPMSSIDYDDVSKIQICIKCCACVNQCPTGAKEFLDTDFVHHRIELERDYCKPKKIEYFLLKKK